MRRLATFSVALVLGVVVTACLTHRDPSAIAEAEVPSPVDCLNIPGQDYRDDAYRLMLKNNAIAVRDSVAAESGDVQQTLRNDVDARPRSLDPTVPWGITLGSTIAGFRPEDLHNADYAAFPAQGSLYYMMLFTTQGASNNPIEALQRSHTFATFLHLRAQLCKVSPEQWQIRFLPIFAHINWMSEEGHTTGKVCLSGSGCRPVEGKDYPITRQLASAKRINAKMATWGPRRITPALYSAALAQARLLSGALGPKPLYLAADLGGRETMPIAYFNCFHAISDLTRNVNADISVYGPNPARTGATAFIDATKVVYKVLSPAIVDPQDNDVIWKIMQRELAVPGATRIDLPAIVQKM